MLKNHRRLILVLATLLPAAFAQTSNGTLTGTVADSSGAVIPQASVVAQNEASGDVRRTVTNNEGYFAFSSLPAATYSIVVELSGFNKSENRGIVLNGGDSRAVNVVLNVATSAEKVQVVASSAVLATVDSGEKSAVITSHELQNLSLVGRNAGELLKILPGATLTANGGVNRPAYTGEVIGINNVGIGGTQGSLSNVSINGTSPDITQDGGHTFDPGSPGGATPVNPNTDMVQEVKVATSNFSAEYAKGPVVMNAVSKGGGREFHGEGYLYARNAALNATDWFNNYSGVPKPDSSYYFPGVNIGGPVLIPGTHFNHNRDKLFFFEGFEYYKQTIDGGVMRAFVPTTAMRSGDFSQANTYGPLQGNLASIPTGPGITNGVIPASMIDPGAKIMLNLYPQPNADPKTNNGYNFKQALLVPQNNWQSLSRVDYSVSDNTKVFVRYNAQRETQNMPTGLWGSTGSDNLVPTPTNIIGANASDSYAASLTHVFSPTMTSETSFDYTYIDFPNSPADPTKLLRKDASFPYHGIYNPQSLPAILSWGGALPTLGTPGNSFHPRMIAVKGIPSAAENLTKVFGTHTTKYGFYFEHIYNKQDNWAQYNGTFEYEPWNTITGNTYADILTGQGFSSYYEQAMPPLGSLGQNEIGFYAQDSWRVNRKLTVEYGMRFDHLGLPYDENNVGAAVFDPSKYNNDPSQLNNHPGLLWHKINSGTPLSGVSSRALFYEPRFGLAYDVFGTGKTVVRGGWGMYRYIADLNGGYYTSPVGTAAGSVSQWFGFKQTGAATWAQLDTHAAPPNIVPGPGSGLVGINTMWAGHNDMPLTTSYSFTVDQTLPKSFLWEVSYVGNHGEHGINTVNINSVPLGALLKNPNANADSYRPMDNYQGVTVTGGFDKSDYNSFQTSLKRNVGMLTLQANYTFAKTMGNLSRNGVLPDYGSHYYWGVLPYNRAQAFSVAYNLDLPNFVHSNRLVEGVINGWQISGISTIQSGQDLLSGNNNNLNFNFSETGASNTINLGTPDMTLNPTLICDPRKNLQPHQYINGACFGPAPTGGVLGAGAFPYIPGPAYFNHDLSVFKNFKVTESQKLQFRFSAFNFLNHPLTSFRPGDNNFNLSLDANGKLSNPTFGYADYKLGHRVVELAIKYYF